MNGSTLNTRIRTPAKSATLADPVHENYCPGMAQLVAHPVTQCHVPSRNARISYYIQASETSAKYPVSGITDFLKRIYAPKYKYTNRKRKSARGRSQTTDDGTTSSVKIDHTQKIYLDALLTHTNAFKQRLAVAAIASGTAVDRPVQKVTHVPIDNPNSRATGKRQKRAMETEVTTGVVAAQRGRKARSGLDIGTMVHRQLEFYIQHGAEKFKIQYHGINTAHMSQILTQLAMYDLHPIATEFPIFSPSEFVGTRVDLICVHRATRELVFVELKTGAIDRQCTYYGALVLQGLRQPSDTFVPDSRLNQAILQLGFCTQVCHETYGIVVPRAYVIICSESDGVTVDFYRCVWFRMLKDMFTSHFFTSIKTIVSRRKSRTRTRTRTRSRKSTTVARGARSKSLNSRPKKRTRARTPTRRSATPRVRKAAKIVKNQESG